MFLKETISNNQKTFQQQLIALFLKGNNESNSVNTEQLICENNALRKENEELKQMLLNFDNKLSDRSNRLAIVEQRVTDMKLKREEIANVLCKLLLLLQKNIVK
ncbi:hypothetical protein ABK040_001950 [Willaertia magna]